MIEQRVARVHNDREHGSRWLVRETLLIMRDLAQMHMSSQDEQMKLLARYSRELAQARPAMAALASAVGRVLHGQSSPAAIAQEATRLLADYDTATQRIAAYAQPYVHGRVMTCSISGTVVDVLTAARHEIEHVIVLEGRPRYEGRAMARALSTVGIPVTLITDAQAAIFLPQCHAIVVGADSILANGDVLNKAGTALLAWAAHGQHIPFYVVCETLKISPRHGFDETWLEEKQPEEVLETAIDGVTVRNFYFDRTPQTLVSSVITERGVVSLPGIQQIAASAQEDARLLNQSSP